MRGQVHPPRVLVLFALVLAVSGPAAPAGADAPTDTQILVLSCEQTPGLEAVFPGYTSSFESAWIPVSPGTPVLPAERRGCAAHFGHHTYLPGNDTVYALTGGTGFTLSVEQFPFSPATAVPALDEEGGLHLVTPIPVQVSLDGLTWTDVATGNYRLLSLADPTSSPLDAAADTLCFNTGACSTSPGPQFTCISIPYGCNYNTMRQVVQFDFQADGQPLRYVRVHHPESIFTGLTGFLDASRFFLEVEPIGAYTPPTPQARTDVVLRCDNATSERFFTDSPCQFGGYVTDEAPLGIDQVRLGNSPGQWDAPSFFHTYPLGNAALDAIRGDVLVRDWRTNGVGPERAIQVQATSDGEAWTTVHTFPLDPVPGDPLNLQSEAGLYAGTFNVSGLNGTHAQLVRLVAEPLPGDGGFWNETTPWPNRHPWAYFHHSEIRMDGLLPT